MLHSAAFETIEQRIDDTAGEPGHVGCMRGHVRGPDRILTARREFGYAALPDQEILAGLRFSFQGERTGHDPLIVQPAETLSRADDDPQMR